MEVLGHITNAKVVAITKYSWLLEGVAPWKAIVSLLGDHRKPRERLLELILTISKVELFVVRIAAIVASGVVLMGVGS